MFRLRLRNLMKSGKRDQAEDYLRGAWHALCAVIGQRDAAVMILRNIDRDHWALTPKGMTDFILEKFANDHNYVVPGDDREPTDV